MRTPGSRAKSAAGAVAVGAAVVGVAVMAAGLMPVSGVRAQQAPTASGAGTVAFYSQQVAPLLDEQCNG